MLSFTLKKWLGALLQPLPFLTLLMILAIYFQVKGAKKPALFSQIGVLIIFLLIATPPVSDGLISAIEGDYQRFDDSVSLEYIVVLGCGHTNNEAITITSQLHNCSLYRVTEGVKLYQQFPNATLVFSGYGGSQPLSNAETNKNFAIALGVPEKKIYIEPRAMDTEEESILLQPILANKTFALVTSASHMQRSLNFFEMQGLKPLPAPTGHLFKGNKNRPTREYLPDASNIHNAETAIYEFLGRTWQKIKG